MVNVFQDETRPSCIFIVLILFAQAACGQSNDNELFILKNLIRQIQPTGTIYFTDGGGRGTIEKHFTALDKPRIKGLTKNTKQNFIKLTKAERVFLLESLKKGFSQTWNSNTFGNSTKIPIDSFSVQIQKLQGQFADFRNDPANIDSMKKITQNYYRYFTVFQFSPIIFIRNNSIFLNYTVWLCGGECGQEELAFYKKENDNWKKWIVVGGGSW